MLDNRQEEPLEEEMLLDSSLDGSHQSVATHIQSPTLTFVALMGEEEDLVIVPPAILILDSW